MPDKAMRGSHDAWEVDVDVYLERDSDPPVFHIESYLQSKNGSEDLVFCNNYHPGFWIRFHLHDKTPAGGYVFPDPPKPTKHPEKWALWSRMGPGCPPKNYGDQWEEFISDRVEDGGLTLVVRNLNKTPTQFGYTLRVTNDRGGHFVELDPGGDNNNGSWGRS